LVVGGPGLWTMEGLLEAGTTMYATVGIQIAGRPPRPIVPKPFEGEATAPVPAFLRCPVQPRLRRLREHGGRKRLHAELCETLGPLGMSPKPGASSGVTRRRPADSVLGRDDRVGRG